MAEIRLVVMLASELDDSGHADPDFQVKLAPVPLPEAGEDTADTLLITAAVPRALHTDPQARETILDLLGTELTSKVRQLLEADTGRGNRHA